VSELRANSHADTLGDEGKDVVTHAVAKRIVDNFEVVQVHEQHGNRCTVTLMQRDGMLESIGE
jgi:hypothetical protein